MENPKRLADNSPEGGPKKRSVFSDITNAIASTLGPSQKKAVVQLARKATKISKKINKTSNQETKKEEEDTIPGTEKCEEIQKEALESSLSISNEETSIEEVSYKVTSKHELLPVVPDDVNDFDKESIQDPFSEPLYAFEIFKYYKERENAFKIKKYMNDQPDLTKSMRAILIDWMVEVQENFELYHETLYLAVKLVDHYLMKKTVPKFLLQLVGSTALFIACKYDEQRPPLIDDFLYICDDAYCRKELIGMERNILKALDFDLGIPLSYRFLRRYARCGKINMEILTLARFILETSLLEYEMIEIPDSLIAAAALLLALKMKNLEGWTPTLEFYSGYKETELIDLMYRLNSLISAAPPKNLQTIRTKYAHKVFFEVSKIPPLKDKD